MSPLRDDDAMFMLRDDVIHVMLVLRVRRQPKTTSGSCPSIDALRAAETPCNSSSYRTFGCGSICSYYWVSVAPLTYLSMMKLMIYYGFAHWQKGWWKSYSKEVRTIVERGREWRDRERERKDAEMQGISLRYKSFDTALFRRTGGDYYYYYYYYYVNWWTTNSTMSNQLQKDEWQVHYTTSTFLHGVCHCGAHTAHRGNVLSEDQPLVHPTILRATIYLKKAHIDQVLGT